MKITVTGRVNDNGRPLLPVERVATELVKYAGKRVVATFEVQESLSEAQLGYYRGYILPTCQKAMLRHGERVSAEEMDEILCGGYYGGDAWKEDASQFSDFILWLQQFAAENLEIFIEDPAF